MTPESRAITSASLGRTDVIEKALIICLAEVYRHRADKDGVPTEFENRLRSTVTPIPDDLPVDLHDVSAAVEMSIQNVVELLRQALEEAST